MSKDFTKYRNNIIGINQTFVSPYGDIKKIIYADWTASGRSYLPIEKRMTEEILPFVANTHTDTNTTGRGMTYAYHKAKYIIKKHVNALDGDVLISSNSGMTGVVNKFQRILGLKIHEKFKNKIKLTDEERPVIFVTHMEHHSNQTSWIETIGDVVIVDPDTNGLVSTSQFETEIKKYYNRKIKIAAITACSNVTGIFTPYHDIARLMHQVGGFCFVDFACAAPYININMHPEDESAALDAIYFSPHKFLGGPGSSGILIFNNKLYHNAIPDNPGGGTVDWTNPWGQHKYHDDIEDREDGGTPSFLQTIRVAFCIKLKEELGVENMLDIEEKTMNILWERLSKINNLHILAANVKKRLGIISFYIDDLHYNLGVRILNDKFGIQTRGGCSCAGTYGHYLLNVNKEHSKNITDLISKGDNSQKPGWIRLSIHPTTTSDEALMMAEGIEQLAANHKIWCEDYIINKINNTIEFKNKFADNYVTDYFETCFNKNWE